MPGGLGQGHPLGPWGAATTSNSRRSSAIGSIFPTSSRSSIATTRRSRRRPGPCAARCKTRSRDGGGAGRRPSGATGAEVAAAREARAARGRVGGGDRVRAEHVVGRDGDRRCRCPWTRGDQGDRFRRGVPGERDAVATRGGAVRARGGVPAALATSRRATSAGLGRLAEELAKGARLVAVSAVQFATGLADAARGDGRARHARGARALRRRHPGRRRRADDVRAPASITWRRRAQVADGARGGGRSSTCAPIGSRARALLVGRLSHEDPIRLPHRGPGHLRYDRPVQEAPRTCSRSGA